MEQKDEQITITIAKKELEGIIESLDKVVNRTPLSDYDDILNLSMLSDILKKKLKT